jgi:hypothetical protein
MLSDRPVQQSKAWFARHEQYVALRYWQQHYCQQLVPANRLAELGYKDRSRCFAKWCYRTADDTADFVVQYNDVLLSVSHDVHQRHTTVFALGRPRRPWPGQWPVCQEGVAGTFDARRSLAQLSID